MDTSKIREAFLSAPEKVEDVEIPDWLAPLLDADTQLAIKDVGSDLLNVLRKQADKDPLNGDVKFGAALICQCLINKATGERIFQSTDRDAIAALGTTKVTSLSKQITEFFGFVQKPVDDAKKNLEQTVTPSPGTSSQNGSLTPV
jgi:hypothetical protein